MEAQIMNRRAVRQAFHEEVANSITHGVGLAFSVIGLVVLIVLACLYGSALHIASCSVYGATMVMLYAASTLYHSFRSPRIKHIFKIIDHCSIYLLIAGTYTPFTLVMLRGGWGWSLFGIIWMLSFVGIVFKLFFVNKFQILSTIVYVLMGWLAIVAIKPMVQMIPFNCILWLVAGGLFYTIGVLFFAWHRIPYNHAIWHVFVVAGSVCHFLAVLLYVIPSSI
jgi:hemolysin III